MLSVAKAKPVSMLFCPGNCTAHLLLMKACAIITVERRIHFAQCSRYVPASRA